MPMRTLLLAGAVAVIPGFSLAQVDIEIGPGKERIEGHRVESN